MVPDCAIDDDRYTYLFYTLTRYNKVEYSSLSTLKNVGLPML